MRPADATLDVGIILRRSPGTGRWARTSWRGIGLLPGAGPADWVLLREEGDVAEFHAGTLPLMLYRSETEAYRATLAATEPALYVMFETEEDQTGPFPALHSLTASAYLAQDHLDSGAYAVERIAMPAALTRFIADFAAEHHQEEPFVKRKRRNWSETPAEGPKVQSPGDVFAVPRKARS